MRSVSYFMRSVIYFMRPVSYSMNSKFVSKYLLTAIRGCGWHRTQAFMNGLGTRLGVWLAGHKSRPQVGKYINPLIFHPYNHL